MHEIEMADHPPRSTTCPLAPVDRRLDDAHRLWHQAERAYFDPEEFRVAIQNAIQTLRTVTFILQKNRNLIPDFDAWYGGWRERLHADALMRWMVEARNKIEAYFEMVKSVFLRDGHHLPFVFFFRQRKLLKIFATPAENQQQKYLLMRKLSAEALRYGADAVMLIDEMWTAPKQDVGPYQRVADVPTRREALGVHLATKTSEPVQWSALIQREGDSVALDHHVRVRR